MKSIVIYNSQTGFTKKYALWIGEEADCECVEIKKVKKNKLSEYDTIVFGGWIKAGLITKLSWFKKHILKLSSAGKTIIVFVTGASAADSTDAAASIRRNFTDDEWSSIKVFYCPGGLNYDRMSRGSKLAMKMLLKIMSCKKEQTAEDKRTIEMISKSYDISDKKYIKPILEMMK